MADNMGFLSRTVAACIDWILIVLVAFPLMIVLSLPTFFMPAMVQVFYKLSLNLVYFVLVICFYTYFVKVYGGTPGKLILGMRIVKLDNSPISWGDAFLRHLIWMLGSWVLCLGLLWIIWDKNKQGWHDILVKTVVIRKPEAEKTISTKTLEIIGGILIALYIFSVITFFIIFFSVLFMFTSAYPL